MLDDLGHLFLHMKNTWQLFSISKLSLSLYGQATRSCLELVPCLLPPRLQSGMNLQICFVNDSSSDKDSDADDSKTETSLDTPLSPMVSPHGHRLSHRLLLFPGCWACTRWDLGAAIPGNWKHLWGRMLREFDHDTVGVNKVY